MALVGLAGVHALPLMPVVLVALAVLLRGQVVKPAEGAIDESESAYNYIQVVEQPACVTAAQRRAGSSLDL